MFGCVGSCNTTAEFKTVGHWEMRAGAYLSPEVACGSHLVQFKLRDGSLRIADSQSSPNQDVDPHDFC